MSEQRLTRRQAAILTAFTGVSCGPFGDFHEYADSLPGFQGIMTMGLALMADQIKEAARADFMAICATKEDADEDPCPHGEVGWMACQTCMEDEREVQAYERALDR